MKIKKAPGAQTNSYAAEIKGISVNPATLTGQHINALVMFTSDDHGETLSIQDPTTKKQTVVPYEAVEQLIIHTRSAKGVMS